MKLRGVFRLLTRLLTMLATGTTLIGLAGVQPAYAFPSVSFRMCTPFTAGPGGEGAACTTGELTWWDRNSFIIDGKVNDRCPADGYEAFTRMKIVFGGGDPDWVGLASDRNGCETDPASYVVTQHRERNIIRVVVEVCEAHWLDPFIVVCDEKSIDNPFTG